MQENLLFFGINESNGNDREDTESTLRTFLKEEIYSDDEDMVDNLVFDRVHRLGKTRWNLDTHPRPIVAKFEKYNDRENVRKKGIELNKKRNGYSVREQFPQEIEQRRKELYPIMRKFQQNENNRVALIRDKLYINGKQYQHQTNDRYTRDTPNNIREQHDIPNHIRERDDISRDFNPRRGNKYRHDNELNRDRQNWRQYENQRNNDYRRGSSLNSDNEYRRENESRRFAVGNRRSGLIETVNRFNALTSTPVTTDSMRQKQKARSPLDQTSVKKYKTNSSDDESDIEIDTTVTIEVHASYDSASSDVQSLPSSIATNQVIQANSTLPEHNNHHGSAMTSRVTSQQTNSTTTQAPVQTRSQ